MIPVYCNGGGSSRLSEGPRPRSGMGGRDNYDIDDDDIDDVDPEVFFEQHAEFNDDNNTTDDDPVEDLPPSCKVFYSQFIMDIGGERKARNIVKKYSPRIQSIIIDHHQFFDYQVMDVEGIIAPKITTRGGVYVTVEKEKDVDVKYILKSVGSTSNFKEHCKQKIKVSLSTVYFLFVSPYYYYLLLSYLFFLFIILLLFTICRIK